MAKLSSPDSIPCPATSLPLPYDGPPVPAWFRDGARVKVKTTSLTRFKGGYGVSVRGMQRDDSAAWAGEIGIVRLSVRAHNTAAEVAAGKCYYGGVPYVANEGGWYRFTVEFSRGRELVVSQSRDLEYLLRAKPAAAEAAQE